MHLVKARIQRCDLAPKIIENLSSASKLQACILVGSRSSIIVHIESVGLLDHTLLELAPTRFNRLGVSSGIGVNEVQRMIDSRVLQVCRP
jgi:hypothetical protein